jgi:hypothetical protein
MALILYKSFVSKFLHELFQIVGVYLFEGPLRRGKLVEEGAHPWLIAGRGSHMQGLGFSLHDAAHIGDAPFSQALLCTQNKGQRRLNMLLTPIYFPGQMALPLESSMLVA